MYNPDSSNGIPKKTAHTPNESLFDTDTSSSSNIEIDELRAVVSNLTRINLLLTHRFSSLDELLNEYLISGREVLQMTYGAVVTIEKTGSNECVIQSFNTIKSQHPYLSENIKQHCRNTVSSEQIVVISDTEGRSANQSSFIGAPIKVGKKVYGCIVFYTDEPRHTFTFYERMLTSLLANGIGAYLLREREAQLMQLNQQIKRFVGYVAHDLRNPLGIILNLSRMGKNPKAKPERLREALSRIESPAETALEFVSTILENAALSTGKISIRPEKIGIEELITKAISDVRHFAAETNSSIKIIHCQLASNGQTIICDTKRIHQTLVNLLINAIKYSPKNAYITVAYRVNITNGSCEIEIENLVASNPDDQRCEKRLYGSVGFGLDIVKDILCAHDTSLIVTHSNEKYCIRFELPQAQKKHCDNDDEG